VGSALDQFGRFARPAKQVLSALMNGPRTPYAIRGEANVRCGVDLGPGTLFGTIARLERRALIEVVPTQAAPRAYRLTALGAATLKAQIASFAHHAPASAPVVDRSPAR